MVSLCQMGVGVITWKKAITVSIITTLQRVFSLFCISTWQSCCPDQKRGQGWYWRHWLERVALQHRLAAACFSIRRKRSRRAGQSTYAGSRGRYIYIYMWFGDVMVYIDRGICEEFGLVCIGTKWYKIRYICVQCTHMYRILYTEHNYVCHTLLHL